MFRDPQNRESDNRRYWLNQPWTTEDKFTTPNAWDALNAAANTSGLLPHLLEKDILVVWSLKRCAYVRYRSRARHERLHPQRGRLGVHRVSPTEFPRKTGTRQPPFD